MNNRENLKSALIMAKALIAENINSLESRGYVSDTLVANLVSYIVATQLKYKNSKD